MTQAPGNIDGLLVLARAEATAASLQRDAAARATLRQQALQHLDDAAATQPPRPWTLALRKRLLAMPG